MSTTINDVISSDGYSNCCGAKVYAPTSDWGICMDCKEYCGIEIETEVEQLSETSRKYQK